MLYTTASLFIYSGALPQVKSARHESHGMTSTDIINSRPDRNLEALHTEESSVVRLSSVAVVVTLERPSDRNADVVGLFLREHSKIGTERGQVQLGHLLVQLLGQQVDIVLVGLDLLPVLQKVQLCQHLIRERARH